MYLIKAIPIARGVGTNTLSYWSPVAADPGSVISAPLRKRAVGAFVVSCEPAQESRSEIRSAGFAVRKIAKPHARKLISAEFFAAAEETARYHASTVGSALALLVPAPILASYDKLPAASPARFAQRPRESLVLQKSDEDRFGHYKSLIRERFARKESVMMILPSADDIRRAVSYFEKGIEPYTHVFHGGLTRPELIKRWKAAIADEHPIVAVATGAFLSLPRPDVGLIIVERESSSGYKSAMRPFVDFRYVAERYARKIGANLIYGDSCLRVETLYRAQEGSGMSALSEYAPLAMRSLSSARESLIDMRSYRNPEHELRIISDELGSLIKRAREENEHAFVFAGRKGLAPQTVCADCETTLVCDRCSAPLVLYGRDEGRFYLCNRCGRRYDAHTTCRGCGSWRLTTLGIGTERVEEEIERIVPGVRVFRLDKASAPTARKAREIIDRWYASPGSVLVGTELALGSIDRPIGYCAVASMDALFSIPDFRIAEKAFSIVLRLRALAERHFLLQTRDPSLPALEYGIKGNIIDFYRSEIEARERFGFPPFKAFIKISASGKKDDVLEDMERLQAELSDWQVDVFPAFVATVRGAYVMHALVKLASGAWPDDRLLEKLSSLPPRYAVNVDPESVL